MDDEKLIELVRRYPQLYDTSHPKYMDTNFKYNIWSKIGAECQGTGSACKARWGNIRDNYRKSLKKTFTASGQKTVKRYKYSQQLRFLTKCLEENMINTNDEATNQDFTGDNEGDSISLGNEEKAGDDTTEDDNPVIVESRRTLPSIPNERKHAEYSVPRKKAKYSGLTPKTAAATDMEYIDYGRNETMDSFPPPSQHPVDAFLSGIAPALKKLSPEHWHYAKSEIFTAAQKYEFKMLTEQQQITEPPLIQTSPAYSSTPSPERNQQFKSSPYSP